MIGNAKLGLLHGQAAAATGALAVVPVEPLAGPGPGQLKSFPRRRSISRKLRALSISTKAWPGRVAILAGSETYTGAAVLAATGALRGGGGLVTLFVPAAVRPMIVSKCPPEIIVRGNRKPTRGVGHSGSTRWWSGAAWAKWIPDRSRLAGVDFEFAGPHRRRCGRPQLHRPIGNPGNPVRTARAHPSSGGIRQTGPGSGRSATRGGGPPICRTQCRHSAAEGLPHDRHPPGGSRYGTIRPAPRRWRPAARATCWQESSEPASRSAMRPWKPPRSSAWLCGRAAEIAMQETTTSEESLTPSDVLRYLGGAFGIGKPPAVDDPSLSRPGSRSARQRPAYRSSRKGPNGSSEAKKAITDLGMKSGRSPGPSAPSCNKR